MDATYVEAVRLLLEAIPVLFKESRFVMKGGTGVLPINCAIWYESLRAAKPPA